jgi:hypothetical protein
MVDVVGLALYGLLVAIVIGVFASILGKAGYSRWYALLLLVPILNILALLILAAREWPIEREVARLRLIAGESTDIDADIECVMSSAIVHEQKRQWGRALSMYNLVADKSTDARIRQYASECAQRLSGNP